VNTRISKLLVAHVVDFGWTIGSADKEKELFIMSSDQRKIMRSARTSLGFGLLACCLAAAPASFAQYPAQSQVSKDGTTLQVFTLISNGDGTWQVPPRADHWTGGSTAPLTALATALANDNDNDNDARGGNAREARAQAEAALRIRESADAYLVLARLDLRENRMEAAAQNINRALQLEPGNPAGQNLKRTLAAKLAEKAQPLSHP